jgi:hypothetical protein
MLTDDDIIGASLPSYISKHHFSSVSTVIASTTCACKGGHEFFEFTMLVETKFKGSKDVFQHLYCVMLYAERRDLLLDDLIISAVYAFGETFELWCHVIFCILNLLLYSALQLGGST